MIHQITIVKFLILLNLINSFNVRIYYWNYLNFGDLIGKDILRRVLSLGCSTKRINIKLRTDIQEPSIFTVGSILKSGALNDNDVVWGSGIKYNNDDALRNISTVKILSVRGPQSYKGLSTRSQLKEVPKIFGDPAILLPYIYPEYNFLMPSNPNKSKILIITHISTVMSQFNKYDTSDYEFISALNDWPTVIEKIRNAPKVLSNSLHGIIISEALEIPCIWISTGLSTEPLLKFFDYYESTDRFDIKPIEDLNIAKITEPIKCDLKKLYDPIINALLSNINVLVDRKIIWGDYGPLTLDCSMDKFKHNLDNCDRKGYCHFKDPTYYVSNVINID